MSADLTESLKQRLLRLAEYRNDDTPLTRMMFEAVLEIERLEAALALALESKQADARKPEQPSQEVAA